MTEIFVSVQTIYDKLYTAVIQNIEDELNTYLLTTVIKYERYYWPFLDASYLVLIIFMLHNKKTQQAKYGFIRYLAKMR